MGRESKKEIITLMYIKTTCNKIYFKYKDPSKLDKGDILLNKMGHVLLGQEDLRQDLLGFYEKGQRKLIINICIYIFYKKYS